MASPCLQCQCQVGDIRCNKLVFLNTSHCLYNGTESGTSMSYMDFNRIKNRSNLRKKISSEQVDKIHVAIHKAGITTAKKIKYFICIVICQSFSVSHERISYEFE